MSTVAADMCEDTDDDIDCYTDWVKEGDWCLFQYIFDASVFYVCKVISINGAKVSANFVQFVNKDKDTDLAHFVQKVNGVEEADLDQVILKLGPPTLTSTATKRSSGYLKFPFDFPSYNLGKKILNVLDSSINYLRCYKLSFDNTGGCLRLSLLLLYRHNPCLFSTTPWSFSTSHVTE